MLFSVGTGYLWTTVRPTCVVKAYEKIKHVLCSRDQPEPPELSLPGCFNVTQRFENWPGTHVSTSLGPITHEVTRPIYNAYKKYSPPLDVIHEIMFNRSPDLNPIENLWLDMKRAVFCKFLSKKPNYIDHDFMYKSNKRVWNIQRGWILFIGILSPVLPSFTLFLLNSLSCPAHFLTLSTQLFRLNFHEGEVQLCSSPHLGNLLPIQALKTFKQAWLEQTAKTFQKPA